MGKRKSIIEVDGRQYEAKYVGRGQYSKVYRVGGRVVMYTKGDCAKEVLAMFRYERMAHLPELIRHENITTRPGIFWYVFSSPYYRNVTKKDQSAWELMNLLIHDYKEWWSEQRNYQYQAYGRVRTDVYVMQKFVNDLKDAPYMTRSVIKALQAIVDVSSNCGDNVGFDFKKNNFGVNEYGTLIFRDVVWVI